MDIAREMADVHATMPLRKKYILLNLMNLELNPDINMSPWVFQDGFLFLWGLGLRNAGSSLLATSANK